jgi:hypothetical protein
MNELDSLTGLLRGERRRNLRKGKAGGHPELELLEGWPINSMAK